MNREHISLVLLKLKALITVILKLLITWLKEMTGIDMVEMLLCIYISLWIIGFREDLSDSDIESIFIQSVKSNYRPPAIPVDYCNELSKLFHFIDAEDKETIYLGDTNCAMLDSTNNDTKHLMKLLTKLNPVQLIKGPTRTTATIKTAWYCLYDKTHEVAKIESLTKTFKC